MYSTTQVYSLMMGKLCNIKAHTRKQPSSMYQLKKVNRNLQQRSQWQNLRCIQDFYSSYILQTNHWRCVFVVLYKVEIWVDTRDLA